MPYTTVLLDLDHTLLDSDQSEVAAYNETMRKHGVTNPREAFPTYKEINRLLWAGAERGELLPGDIRTRRFELFVAKLGIDADPGVMADDFVLGLADNGDLYPGTRTVLEQLQATVRLGMITNGLSEVQRARIQRLDLERFFDAIVISAEVGCTKPGSEIFDIAFERFGYPDKADVLMVGDSLSSDIRGGSNYGLATCWYNSNGKKAGLDDRVTHEIRTLAELIDLV